MTRERFAHRRWPAALAVLAVAAASAAWAQEPSLTQSEESGAQQNPPQAPPIVSRLLLAGDDVEDQIKTLTESLVSVVNEPPAKLSEYWLGVNCEPAGETLRAQLGLGEGEGLVVRGVEKESPAAKAGIQSHDVLIAAGDQRLKDVAGLMKVLDENKEKTVTLKLYRAGKEMKLEATAAKRPEGQREIRIRAPEAGQLARDLRLRFFHPGLVLPPGKSPRVELPDDVSVQIERHGKDPAKIRVRRGDKKWELTEEQLGNLPEDMRPLVEGMLGRGGLVVGDQLRLWLEKDGDVLTVRPGGKPEIRSFRAPPGGAEGRLERRFEELGRQMKELREELRQLRQPRLKKEKTPGAEESVEEEAEF